MGSAGLDERGIEQAGLQLTASSSQGSVTLSGIPFTATANPNGTWVGKEKEGPMNLQDSITFINSVTYPGLFDFSGSSSGPLGPSTFTGVAIVSSKGKAVGCDWITSASGTSTASWSGSFNFNTLTGAFTGINDSGQHMRISLSYSPR